MMKKMRSRLRSQKGESIAEVLVAVLVSMVALTMLALMITATTKMGMSMSRAVTSLSKRTERH